MSDETQTKFQIPLCDVGKKGAGFRVNNKLTKTGILSSRGSTSTSTSCPQTSTTRLISTPLSTARSLQQETEVCSSSLIFTLLPRQKGNALETSSYALRSAEETNPLAAPMTPWLGRLHRMALSPWTPRRRNEKRRGRATLQLTQPRALRSLGSAAVTHGKLQRMTSSIPS